MTLYYSCNANHRDLHTFPTRRSSDLEEDGTRFTRAERITAQLRMDGIGRGDVVMDNVVVTRPVVALREERAGRSEEHTSELQSRENLVCRLLLEKKKSRHSLVYVCLL